MSEDKARKKKSIKRKNSSSDSKNKKNADTALTSSRPCDQEPKKPEDAACSPSKIQRTKLRFPRSAPQVPPKKSSPVSARLPPYHVRINRTSSGSLYYKLSCFPRRRKPDPVSDYSSSTSFSQSSGAGDAPLRFDASTAPRTDTKSRQDANSTHKTNKKKKQKKSQVKLRDKNTDVIDPVPSKDATNKTLHKPGSWINSFKIVSLPKVSSNEIAARSRAFEESCEKYSKNAKEAAGSLSQVGDRKLKPLPTGPPNESSTYGGTSDSVPESSIPSAPESSIPNAGPDAKEACLQESVPSGSNKIFVQSGPQGLGTHSWLQSCTNLFVSPEVWKLEAADSFVPLQDSEDAEEEMQIVEDLLTARSEKKLDLAVAQTCGELTSMDIDSPEDDVHNSPVNTTCSSLLIVLDTNILISHLQFIMALKAKELPGFGKPVLIIPWVVLQELDYMKSGKLQQNVKLKAIPAVQFIYNCLKNQDPQLWGQSMQQASQKMYGLSAENNDDRVLHCCIQYQKLYPNARHLLCTDDKNLCNKSLVSDVKAVFKGDLLATIQNLIMTTKGLSFCLSLTPLKEDQVSPKTGTSGERSRSYETNPFKNVITELEKCLGQALAKILETEMRMAYDDLWHEVLFLKPPWSLSHLLQCFKKHWIAVFGMFVKRDKKREVVEAIDFLHDNLCKGVTIDYMLITLLMNQSRTLLNAFSPRSNYDGVLPQACAQISQLLKTISQVKDGCLQKSSKPKEAQLEKSTPVKDEHELVQKMACDMKSEEMQHSQHIVRHQEVWTVLESLCNTIARYSNEVFQKLTEIQALILLQPITNLTPLQEAFMCLQKLMVTVKNIILGIQRVMATNSRAEDVLLLYNVLLNNEIQVANIKFSSQELYECLCQNDYRQKLTIGCYQLGVLEYTMKTVNESICLEAKNRGWM